MEILPGFNWSSDNPPILNFPYHDAFIHYQVALMKVFIYLACLEHNDYSLLANVASTVMLSIAFMKFGHWSLLFWVACVWVGVAVFSIGRHHRIMVVGGLVYFLQGFLLERKFQFIVDCFMLHQVCTYILKEKTLAAICLTLIPMWRLWELYMCMYSYFLCTFLRSANRTPLQVAFFWISAGHWSLYILAKIVGVDYYDTFMTRFTGYQ